MSYRIVYGPEIPAPELNRGGAFRIQMWTAVFLLVFALLVRQMWPEGTRILRNYLLPGDLTVTEAALSDMVAGLQVGQPAGEALTAFCRQIIHGQVG